MENKYYTPEEEEFHKGFEFEANYTKEGWQKEVFGGEQPAVSSLPQLLYSFLDGKPMEGNIRVKCLDREDIESMGWLFKGKSIDNWYELEATRAIPLSNHVNRSFTIQHDYSTDQGIIIKGYEYQIQTGEEETLYRGACKNKSKFIEILKQIGINE